MHTFELGAAAMARAIRDGELTSVQAVESCIARAEAVDPTIRALTHRRFDEALEEARAADAALAAGEPIGPLHGVPITVKDQFRLAGTAVTFGLKSREKLIDDDDGPLVKRLREAGAIVLSKTNVLQLLMGWECGNDLWGQTNNPWDLERTPGGSSGGEAAAVASGISPLGLGADFGGSIRLPAAFCGVCGFKPTGSRLTALDTPGEVFAQQEAIMPQAGPIAREVEDLVLAMSVLAAPGQERFDPSIPPVPWPDPALVDVSDLRIGWFVEDGLLRPSPAIRRAVADAAAMFEAAGATVVPITPPAGDRVVGTFIQLVSGDRMVRTKAALGSEPASPALGGNLAMASTPGWMAPLVAMGMDWSGQPRVARLLREPLTRRTVDYFEALRVRRELLMDVLDRMDAVEVDLMLGPVVALPAFLHGSSVDLLDAASFTVAYNALGFPAGVVPVTTVGKDEQSDRESAPDRAVTTAQRVEQGSEGMPVAVQIAGRPWREDLVLKAMGVLQEQARMRPDWPVTPRNP